MSGNRKFNEQYDDAEKQYKQALSDYKRETSSAINKFESSAKDLTGEKGYESSIDMASRGANITAGQAGQQAQNAYRSAGLSKAQAAQLAGGAANQAYQNQFTQQQGMAANQLGNQLNAQAQTTGQRIGAGGTALGTQGNMMSNAQQEAQNRYNRKWGGFNNTVQGIGTIGGAITNAVGAFRSDERLKDKVNLTARDYSDKIGVILNRHQTPKKRCYKELIYEVR